METTYNNWYFNTPDSYNRLKQGLLPVDTDKVKPHLNYKRVDKMHELFGNLQLADVPGQPYIRDLKDSLGWFMEIAELTAGSLSSEGHQRLHELMILIPKKNGKTTLTALLLLVLMMMSPRANAKFVFIGKTRDVADIAFSAVADAIALDDDLLERFHVRDHLKVIVDRHSGCKLSVETLDKNTVTGLKASCVMLDEVHLYVGKDDSKVIGQLRGSRAAIKEGQIIATTTLSDSKPVGYFKSELEKMRKIRDGESYLKGVCPVLYEFPEELQKNEDFLFDSENWHIVNPSVGGAISLDILEDSFRESDSVDITEKYRWLSQHLNVELKSNNLLEDSWMPDMTMWDNCKDDRAADLDWILDNCDVLTVGIDSGGSYDFMSCCILGRKGDDHFAWFTSTLYKDAIKKQGKVAALFQDFVDAGDLKLFDPGEDFEYLSDLFSKLKEHDTWPKLKYVGFDQYGMGDSLRRALEGLQDGTGTELLDVKQGYRLAGSLITILRSITQGHFYHDGKDLVAWCVSNAKKSPNGAIVKDTDITFKTDAVIALAVAMELMSEVSIANPADSMIG